jgi:hypothetical protein
VHGRADDVGPLGEPPLPEAIVEDHDRRSPRCFILRRKIAPEHRRNTEQPERVRAHGRRAHVDRPSLAVTERERSAAHISDPFKRVRPRAPLFDVRE